MRGKVTGQKCNNRDVYQIAAQKADKLPMIDKHRLGLMRQAAGESPALSGIPPRQKSA
jgi:hypothetical protein